MKLTPQTWIPIGVAVAAIMAFAGGAVWINSNFQSLQFQNGELSRGMARLEQRIDTLQDRWTARDMQQWIELLRAKNGTLSVPDAPR